MGGTEHSERFPTTRTTLVEALMGGGQQDVALASELLARAYYKPIHKYIRIRWRAADEHADDLTQSFFEQVVVTDRLTGFTPGRAKLRTFIRRFLDNFVVDHERRRRTLKRGGNVQKVAFDDEVEGPLGTAPEELFHREWVRRLLELARSELDAELTSKNKTQHLDVFRAIHDADPPPPHEALAATLGISTTDVNNRLGYARRAYRQILVRLVTQLTANSEEREAELAALKSAV